MGHVLARKELYLLGLVMGLGIAQNDFYLSCIPSLCQIHDISPHALNSTLSFYFFATASSCLCYNLFLRSIAKRTLFIAAFSIFFFACIFLAIADTEGSITILRILQGIAIGCIQPAVVSQIKQHSQKDFSSAMSSASLSAEVMCTFAPIIGSIGFSFISWRFPFLSAALFSFILFFFVASKFTDTFQPKIYDHPLKKAKRVLSSFGFLRFNTMSALMIGLGWGVVTISAHIYDNPLNHGLFYALYGVLYGGGCFICERQFISSEKILHFSPIAAVICCLSITTGLILDYTWMLSGAMLLFALMSGLVYGPIMDRALKGTEKDQVDMASSLFMFSRLLSSGLFIMTSSYLYFKDKSLFIAFIAVSFFALISLTFFQFNKKFMR